MINKGVRVKGLNKHPCKLPAGAVRSKAVTAFNRKTNERFIRCERTCGHYHVWHRIGGSRPASFGHVPKMLPVWG